MKISLIFSITMLIYSCASRKFNGPVVCQFVPEIPTKIIKQSVEPFNDTLSNFSFHLKSLQEDIFFEGVKIRISELKSNTISGCTFDSNGNKEVNVKPGYYSIEIFYVQAPDFVIDSLQIISGKKYKFEIMLGELSGYQMVQLKNK